MHRALRALKALSRAETRCPVENFTPRSCRDLAEILRTLNGEERRIERGIGGGLPLNQLTF